MYTNIDFAPFEFDARFERLIKRYRNDSFEKVYEFLGKLYGRMKLAERRNEGNYDPTALSIAISEVTPGEADEVLRKHGLI